MAVEIFLNIIAPYPFLYDIKYSEYVAMSTWSVTVEYDVNDLLLFFCFIRIYLVCRYILLMT